MVYIVKVHFAVNADSKEEARQRIIEATEGMGEIDGLESSCVDNEDEIEIELDNAG